MEDKTWKVIGFIEDHTNHMLSSPDKAKMHRSHQQFHRSKRCKKMIQCLQEDIPPSTISHVINTTSGREDKSVAPQQCIDYMKTQRHNNIGNECISVIQYFQRKAANDADFYFALEVDSDEQEETFVWLFQEWLNCMHGIEPGAIITDQDRAMCNAIHKVFPNTRHRYCYWHLQRHIADHLHTLNSVYGEEFQKYWDLWCNSGNIENFNLHWLEMKEKFKIIEEEDGWLQTMYMYRDHWVSCFLKGIFFAGMRSTQRSESINSFFDGYVNSQTQLKEFVTQYETAVIHRRLSKAHEDFRTLNTKPQFHLGHPIERQAGSSYTRTMFHVFQNEIKGCGVLGLQEVTKEEKFVLWRVGDLDESNEKWRFVTYDECRELQYSCSCDAASLAGEIVPSLLVLSSFQEWRR
ncbi:protein FAR1-RELATED SEQUENCE 5-like [Asparagus officinalis]|uniref:protein FAR1-RELATED SEQUENCE 5-like n=1 Tax=Asparagus officinalis TaxID=4686 RepID=UPI00098E2EC1|nr:protein FAR1-RELATED SEQUENCE 5-like [Asparagus officinalis]